MQNGDGLVNCSTPAVVSKLDISGVLGSSASIDQRQTEMLEAACLAIIRIERLEGQEPPPSPEQLATALDDVGLAWKAAAHTHGLQLIRWESQR